MFKRLLIMGIVSLFLVSCRVTGTPELPPSIIPFVTETPLPTLQPVVTPEPSPTLALLWWELAALPITLRPETELPEMDAVFFRADGLWLYDSAQVQERLVVAAVPSGYVPASLVWSPDRARVAYLTYDTTVDPPWLQGHLNVVELQTGATTVFTQTLVLLACQPLWDASGTALYIVSATEVASGGLVWHIYLQPLDAALPRVLLTESRTAAAFSCPLQLISEGYVRYLHFESHAITVQQFDPLQGVAERVGSIPGAVVYPFVMPYHFLPDDQGMLYLLATGRTGWEEREGLHYMVQGQHRHLLFLEGGCGLEAGLGQDYLVALGCGMGESGPLVICDTIEATCWQLHEALRQVLPPLLNSENLPYSALKFAPLGWRGEHLYFTAAVVGPDVAQLGASLFRYAIPTGEVVLLLSGFEGIALAP